MYSKNVYKNIAQNGSGYYHVKVMYSSCTVSVELPQAEVCFRYGSD